MTKRQKVITVLRDILAVIFVVKGVVLLGLGFLFIAIAITCRSGLKEARDFLIAIKDELAEALDKMKKEKK